MAAYKRRDVYEIISSQINWLFFLRWLAHLSGEMRVDVPLQYAEYCSAGWGVMIDWWGDITYSEKMCFIP